MESSNVSSPSPSDLQKEYTQLAEELQKLVTSRQQLLIQLNENEGVRSELALLSSSAELFRTIGPALVKTEPSDARALVDGRIDLIKKDLLKVENLVEEKVSVLLLNADHS